MTIDPGFAAQLAQDLPPEDLRMVLGVFRADLDRLSGQLRDCSARADMENFRRTAHSLAGAAGAVGAAALEQICRQAMTRTDLVPTELAVICAGIDRLCAAALADLTAFAATLAP